MALATRCPRCQSMFRVVADQLKLRGGLVRCGSCRHVFDAVGALAYIDDNSLTGRPTLPAGPPQPVISARSEPAPIDAGPPTLMMTDLSMPTQSPVPAEDEPAGDVTVPFGNTEPITDGHAAAPPRAAQAAGPVAAEGPATRPGIEITAHTATGPGAEARHERTPEEEARRAAREARRRARKAIEERRARAAERGERLPAAEAQDEDDTPTFLQAPAQPRGFSIFFTGGSVLLALALAAQLAILYRVELATQVPALRPTLVQLCQQLGCTVGLPTRADLLAVVGTELQAVPGTDVLELTAVLRNRASFQVALPSIEVTLTDTQNRPVARKVFAPADYLTSAGEPSSRIQEGLAAGADYVLRINFEARGLNAAGFVIYPFYL